MKFYVVFCLLLLSIAIAGCGRGHVPLKGRVTFADTDEPLSIGSVFFLQDDFQARGNLDKDGYYTMGSFHETDGLPPGTYAVYIQGAQINEEDAQGRVKTTHLIDEKYEDAPTSGLTVEVDGSTRTFDFKVERPQKGR